MNAAFEDFFLARNRHILRFEALFYINTKRALRQIPDVPFRCQDFIVLAEIFF